MIAALMIILAGCKWDPSNDWETSNFVPEVRLISDSPEVRLLIEEQEKSDAAELEWLKAKQPRDERVRGVEDRRRNPERYAPTLRPFIAAMAAKPSFGVRGGTSCRIVERSHARCTSLPLDTLMYVKVRIMRGPNHGQEGWACEGRDVVPTAPYL
jgi:hypothetical protein